MDDSKLSFLTVKQSGEYVFIELAGLSGELRMTPKQSYNFGKALINHAQDRSAEPVQIPLSMPKAVDYTERWNAE